MQITQSYHPTFHHSLSSISLSFPTPCYNSFLAMTSFQLFLYPPFISSSLPFISSNLLSFSSHFLFSLTFLQSLLHLYSFHPIHRPLSIYSINPHPMLFKILPSSYLPVNLPFSTTAHAHPCSTSLPSTFFFLSCHSPLFLHSSTLSPMFTPLHHPRPLVSLLASLPATPAPPPHSHR